MNSESTPEYGAVRILSRTIDVEVAERHGLQIEDGGENVAVVFADEFCSA